MATSFAMFLKGDEVLFTMEKSHFAALLFKRTALNAE
jgi:hypothetical protein